MKVLVNLKVMANGLPFLDRWIKKHDPKITFKIVGTVWKPSKFAIMWSKIRELFGVNSTEFWIEKSKIGKWVDARNEFSSRNGSYR